MNADLPTSAPFRAEKGAKAGKSEGVRGRPQASSREMLQEAAFELFLENSYAKTTVEQIANRAGVSRNTFFNYFAGKSDVFWVDLDDSLALLGDALGSPLAGTDRPDAASAAPAPVMTAIHEALLATGRHFGPSRVPWALTQYSLIGSVHELQASAISRLAAHATLLDEYIVRRAPLAGEATARAAAYAILGATIGAAQTWASAGTARGPFEPYLDEALTPVCRAFAPLIDR
jgi:AcrR family transcriptional regulator